MVTLHSAFKQLGQSYVFRQVNERTSRYAESHPDASIIKMGVGNTTRPLSPTVVAALHNAVDDLSRPETYTGYGDELGERYLREDLAKYYNQTYGLSLSADEFVLSDGAKSDTANLPSIFEHGLNVAVQDPVYPVYVESNILAGNTLVYMECNEANGFVPAAPDTDVDLIYICSPNNPTGTVATREQLSELVQYARSHNAIIIFDAAYSSFIRDTTLPRSIYEIDGAEQCAIEVNSFSKWIGFSGVRLAWSIVPNSLEIEHSEVSDVLNTWRRRQLVYFNGPSNIAQKGARAALTPEGLQENKDIVDGYLANAQLLASTFSSLGFTCYGGQNSPYVWVKCPDGKDSWQFFDELLENVQIVTTPGVGFGTMGEGFIRVSGFSSKENTEEAVRRFTDYFSNESR